MIVYKNAHTSTRKEHAVALVSYAADGPKVGKVILFHMAFGSFGALGVAKSLVCALPKVQSRSMHQTLLHCEYCCSLHGVLLGWFE